MGYTKGYRDTVIIPDKYNTGCKGELVSMSEFFGDLYTEGEALYITSSVQSKVGTLFENIDFTNAINISKANLSSMIFRNCRFSTSATYAVTTGGGANFSDGMEVVFENCEFLNQTSACIQPAPNIKLYHCKIHDMGGDGGKVFSAGTYSDCYFYNIGFNEGAHADGIQVTGANTDFSIINCRFDMPKYANFIPNAAIFFVLEGDSYNPIVKDCVMTGGNYTFYFGRKYPDAETPVVIENAIVENITIGCTYHFGGLNNPENLVDENEIKAADKLFISSVYQKNGKIKLLVTNYTSQDKVLVVVTDKGEISIDIPACPLYDDGIANNLLTDFPFDIEVEVEGSYVVCYDTSVLEENQIRYVWFGESSEITTVKELLVKTCDAIRAVDGTTEVINHIDIPQRILNLQNILGRIVLESISVSKSVTDYVEGDSLSINDIVVMAIYSDGSSVDVTTNAIIDTSLVDMNKAAIYIINVSYTEAGITKTGTIELNVVANKSTLPEQSYDYYGLFEGIHSETEEKYYVYITSATQKNITASAGVWKLTTNSGQAKVYGSVDQVNWDLLFDSSVSTVNLKLKSSVSYTYEGNILLV